MNEIKALCVWREAQNCSDAARQAVLSAINNRVAKHFMGGFTAAEVILKKFQFSSFNWNDINAQKFPHPTDVKGWGAWLAIGAMVEANPPDNTNGADSYFDKSIQPPVWATPDKLVAVIEPFHFYKEQA